MFLNNNKTGLSQHEKMRRASVYSTAKINDILDDMNKGYLPDNNPFFCGDRDFRDANIIFDLTEEEKAEWKKCFSDCLYFVSKYVPFENDNGVTLVKLRDYQKKFIHLLTDEYYDDKVKEFVPVYRYLISMQSRQLGKTTTVCSTFIWYMITHNDRHLAIVANKGETVKEIIRKITSMISHLPFFLKPGIKNKNMSSIYLDNGSFIKGFATSTTPSIGFTIHVLYIDEAALISPNIMDAFWNAVFPTLSSSKLSKLIMTSTPRGKNNKFYEIWSKAVRHENSFKSYRVDYWQNPMFDDKWAAKMRKDFGEIPFAQDFELKFDVETDKVVRPSDLSFLSFISRKYKNVDIPIMPKEISECFFWHPDFNPLDHEIQKSRYLLSIDTAEGTEKGVGGKKDSDYNIINIFRIELMNPSIIRKFSMDENYTLNDCFRYRQVGLFIDNSNDEEFLAKALKYLVYKLFKSGGMTTDKNQPPRMIDNCRILLEINYNGKNVVNIFRDDDQWYDSLIIKTYHRKPIPGEVQRMKYGFITSAGSSEGNRSKVHFCDESAKMITKRQIICTQTSEDENKSTLKELSDFGKVMNKAETNYTYKGIELHDDIAMTVMNVSRVCDQDQLQYQDWLDEYMCDILPDSKRKNDIFDLLHTPDKKHSLKENTLTDDEFHNFYSNVSMPDGQYPAIPGVKTSSTNPYLNSGNGRNPYLGGGMHRNPYLNGGNGRNPYLNRRNVNPYLKK